MIDDFIRVPWNRDDRDEIDERGTALSVVDETCLAFFSRTEHSLHMRYCFIVGVLSSRSLYYLGVRAWTTRSATIFNCVLKGRTLQEPAISANDLSILISSQHRERGRRVDYGVIILADILLEGGT